uniref:Uncharacterized protein LOC111108850 n=1 Tax=Crassostrea virginica TaxID=6565 RepID=A0A8B8BB41_CRAVI|nr:uncharacterized protein LOC111108850 [Crassostrea virginica]
MPCLFSFTNTDVASPADIDTSCLTIDNSTLGTSYLGLLLFLSSENASCREHFKLETIRKEIIRDEHDRRRCKTEFTMSIQNQYCARIVRFLCKRKSYYFQECKGFDTGMYETYRNDTDAITMSAFLTPKENRYGHMYEIPKAHCKIKRLHSDSHSTSLSRFTNDGIL